ncbi:MAG TPA: L-fucose:H+ symporter permease [Xylella sp.]
MTSRKTVNNNVAMVVATTIFFMWGFLTCLNDILVPHLKGVFELNFAQAMLVQFTFFGAYFLMSLPAEYLVSRLGYKNGIVAGLVIAGMGTLGFWPAAQMRVYGAFLGALFVLATGITVLQVAANPFVSLLGSERTASARLTLAQAFNSLGTAIAPLLGGWLILSGTVKSGDELKIVSPAEQLAYRMQEAQSVQGSYLALTLVLVFLAVMVFLFRLPALRESIEHNDQGSHHTLVETLRHPHVMFGVVAIFCYVGAEVAIGSLMVSYFSMPHIGGFSEQQATHYVGIYWTLAMVGRFAGSGLLAFFQPRRLLALFALINAGILGASVVMSGMMVVYALVAIGLFNSIMFPTIFTLGIERLGLLTGRASSLMIMAIVGGAVVPYLQGMLADRVGLQLSFLLPLFCYLYIVFYGIWGSCICGVLAESRS